MDSVLVPSPHTYSHSYNCSQTVSTSFQKCLILTAWRRLLVLAGLILRTRNLARTWLREVWVCEEYLNWPKVCLWAGGLLHRKQQSVHNCVWISILSQQVVESSQRVVVIGCHWGSNFVTSCWINFLFNVISIHFLAITYCSMFWWFFKPSLSSFLANFVQLIQLIFFRAKKLSFFQVNDP